MLTRETVDEQEKMESPEKPISEENLAPDIKEGVEKGLPSEEGDSPETLWKEYVFWSGVIRQAESDERTGHGGGLTNAYHTAKGFVSAIKKSGVFNERLKGEDVHE